MLFQSQYQDLTEFYQANEMPRLSEQQRFAVLGLVEAGVNQRVIAGRFNVHESTITRLIRRYRTTGSVKDRPRTGQPRVTTRRQDAFIRQRHLRDRFTTSVATSRDVVGRHGRRVHPRTVRRRLRERGILCRRPLKGVILTQRHRRNRVRWARRMLANRRNWRDVVFSDESRFNLSHADGRQRVYRRRKERYAENCVIQHDKFGGGGVMVWGAINHNFRSSLVILRNTLTARRYIDEVLRPELLPLIRRHQNVNNPLTFQQDNARPHTARLTMNFLNTNGVNIMDFPARSPDLNPIEHMWDELGRRLNKRQRRPGNVRELAQALREEWNNIPVRRIRTLCQSMRSRLTACENANGGHTHY